MATAKLFGREMKPFKDSDFDELLSKLSKEEIEELHLELIESEDSVIQPSDRCRYKIDKESTGPFDRQRLLDYLENKAKEEKDWQDVTPFTKQTRGKIWKPKEIEKIVVNKDEVQIDTEWDDALNAASEEELADLAAVLGFHGMLNQVEYHHAFTTGGKPSEAPGGFRGVAKCEPCKPFEYEQPNKTNVKDSINSLKSNASGLTELNLNNIKGISFEDFSELAESLKNNSHLHKLHMANTQLSDKVVKKFAEAIAHNKTLTVLNIESNFITGPLIVELITSINVQKSIIELKVANQRSQVLGVKHETRIAELVRDNHKLLKVGIFLEVPGARNMLSESLQRNNDDLRKIRKGE